MRRRLLCLWGLLNEYGVQIMTPLYVADPPKPLVVEKDKWHAAPSRPEGGEEPPMR